MGHEGEDPAVPAPDASHAARAAVRVVRVAFRPSDTQAVVNVPQRHEALVAEVVEGVGARERCPALAVRDDDREGRAVHAVEEDGRRRRARLVDLDHGEARLELPAGVLNERRPVLGAGDQFPKARDHLAAVAHTERERVRALEEVFKLLARMLVLEDGLRPADAGAENIAVREAAARRDAHKVSERPAREHVRHVHVDGVEARRLEGEGHLAVAVDAHLAEDGDAGRLAEEAAQGRRQGHDVLRGREGKVERQAGVGRVGHEGVLAVGGRRVVPLPLHRVRCPRPPLLHLDAAEADDGRVTAVADVERLAGLGLDDAELADEARGRAAGGEAALEVGLVLLADLENGAKLLVEEGLEEVVGGARLGDVVEHEVDAAAAGEHHLGDGGHEATIRYIVSVMRSTLRTSGASLPICLSDCARAEPPMAFLPSARSTYRRIVSPTSSTRRSWGVQVLRTSSTMVTAVMMTDMGAVTLLASPDSRSFHDAFIEVESLPTGIEILSWGHSSMQMARTASYRPAPSPGWLTAAIQLADSFTRSSWPRKSAAPRLSRLSATAMRAEAAGEMRASWGFSPMAMTSPVRALEPRLNEVAVTAQSATGVCQGPTIWSRTERPPTVLSPMVMRKDFEPTAGMRKTRSVAAVMRAAASRRGSGEGRQVQFSGLDDTLEAAAGREEGIEGEVNGHGVLGSDIREGASFATWRFGLAKEQKGNVCAKGKGVSGRILTADADEAVDVLFVDKQDVTLLGFIAPNLQRAHTAVCAVDLAKLELATETGILDKFGEGVGQTASADIMDHGNRALLAQSGAGIDDHLGAALHLRVATLDTGKVQLGRVLTDEHGWTTENDGVCPVVDVSELLEGVLRAHGSDTTGDHDGLVVAAPFRRVLLADVGQQGAETTEQAGSSELVVEAGAADGGLQHDVETAGEMGGLAQVDLPRGLLIGNQQVRHPETAETGFGGRTATDGTLVANLTSCTGGGTGEGGDGGGVIVRLDLDKDVDDLLGKLPATSGVVRGPEAGGLSLEHGGIVTVGGDGEVGVGLVGVLDHAKESVAHLLLVDGPVGVELLVAAVLRVNLGEHEELHVVGVAAEALEDLDEVLDLGVVHGQAELLVVGLEGGDGVGIAKDVDDL
ncbi:hypothetical protein CTA2_3501 [Colletotrichum tanaceti]|nr:hypothetical protein CTA2_3501 [Colletotrichum tanaceti]